MLSKETNIVARFTVQARPTICFKLICSVSQSRCMTLAKPLNLAGLWVSWLLEMTYVLEIRLQISQKVAFQSNWDKELYTELIWSILKPECYTLVKLVAYEAKVTASLTKTLELSMLWQVSKNTYCILYRVPDWWDLHTFLLYTSAPNFCLVFILSIFFAITLFSISPFQIAV